jgi:redox-sensitive bicupin YhaK (pirin superfamily)
MTDPILETITPVSHDLGSFKVHRALPSKGRTMVGPFVFFDDAGPAIFGPGDGIDVRPHPHIG